MGLQFPKASKGDRVRAARTTKATEARAYRTLCRAVDIRDGYKCRVCKRSVVPGGVEMVTRGEHHHVTYRSLGGKHQPANLILICGECHGDIHAGKLFVEGPADGRLVITGRG